MTTPLLPYQNGTAPTLIEPLEIGGETEAAEPVARPIVSELDRWARRNHNAYADELDDEGQAALLVHILKLAEQEREHFRPAHDRMRQEHSVFALQTPSGALGHTITPDNRAPQGESLQNKADNVELVTLNDPYTFGLKVINTLSAAGHQLDMPSRGLDDMDASQQVERFLDWWWDQWIARSRQTAGGDPRKAMGFGSTIRGWICVLTMPDSRNKRFPWRFVVVDPLEVCPRRNEDGLVRVFRQYQMTALDAREAYPEAEDMLQGYEDADMVRVVAFYDRIYSCVILEGKEIVQPGGGKAATPDGRMIKAPTAHGFVNFDDEPEVPWIIEMPNGDYSAGMPDGKDSTEMMGVGLLFGLHEVYNAVNKIVSMLLTQVAKSTDPPTMQYLDPANPEPRKLRLQAGSQNYAWYKREEIQILDLAPNPGNLQSLLPILLDRLQKGTLPGVSYGEIASGISGYAVNLLNSAVRDQLASYATAIESVERTMFRRVLEIYRRLSQEWASGIPITYFDEAQNRRMGMLFDPQMIEQTGVDVDVKFGSLLPQDELGMLQMAIQAHGAGLLSRYAARKKAGVKDPNLEEKRQLKETLLQNPAVMQILGVQALTMSDDEFVKKGFAILQQLGAQGQDANRQTAEQQRQAGSTAPMPTQVMPLEQQVGPAGQVGQAPPANDPAAQMQRQADAGLAQELASRGGSPPAP